MEGYGKRVLVVDDDEQTRCIMTVHLEAAGYNVHQAGNGPEALLEYKKRRFDVVVSDYSMPFMNGLDLLRKIRELHAGTPVILVSAMPPDLTGADKSAELFACLRKPYEGTSLLKVVRSAVQ